VNSRNHSGIVGLDIGGANLKYATPCGAAYSRHFEMWRHAATLADTIATDLNLRFGSARRLAITMTGELADCFIDRSEGVDHIVRHATEAARRIGIDDVQFYGVDGHFRTSEQARIDVDDVAAANWHALATFVATELATPGRALLIDIGSTTTDIIPLLDGQVATDARTDHERLREGSLLYIGCRRTPVCALVDRLRFRGQDSSVMNELFATIDDARIVLGMLSARAGDDRDSRDCDTADGKPRTAEMAANRLSRMIGLDRRNVTVEDARELALQIHAAAKRAIHDAVSRFADPDCQWIISGHGDDLIDVPSRVEATRLVERLGMELSRCAPCFAVARLLHSDNRQACH
jgi:probable H4MPT-linked C1 transfer pathway protein